ncbi:hypothetical protein HELRODRAFT_67129, partial [Helobdella robusta]|uniref:Very-long-chain (3R)-3-hydroxyacyl-CoA dehydratase n=1 Tax=Helobdella robusta TaxID=6412 RepID=T1FYW8_HELRO
WSVVAIQSILFLIYTTKSYLNIYDDVHCSLLTIQTLAFLEIVHAALGLVRSDPVITTFQISSRVFLLWGVANLVDESNKQVGFLMLLFAWTLTELIRYLFYLCALLNKVPYLLTYARYTLFIALYPIGVTGELLTIYNALPLVNERGILTISLPNSFNISFSYCYFLIFVMLTYIPVFPPLYLHMFAQRKKVLNAKPEKKFN